MSAEIEKIQDKVEAMRAELLTAADANEVLGRYSEAFLQRRAAALLGGLLSHIWMAEHQRQDDLLSA
jgi:hypothetical protein